MINSIKRRVKHLLPVTVDIPAQQVSTVAARRFITLSLKRSGQHAVINWLCSQIQNTIHFNHCTFKRRYLRNWISPINNRITHYSGSEKFDSGIQSEERMTELLSDMTNYSSLLYSFEDLDIDNKLLKKYVSSNNPTVILIIRDPYNCFASTMKRRDCDYDALENKKYILKKYLHNATGSIMSLGVPVVTINYNLWVTDSTYREHICTELDISFSPLADKSIMEVPDFGGGSSFDGINPRSDSKHTDVFERWKEFESDRDYRNLMNDTELMNLTKSFFGIDCPF